jgi:hypothetical protein
MIEMYVYEKATNKTVAVIQGPCAASCEHAAGHIDEQGKQPLCSEDLCWGFDASGLSGLADAPVIQAEQLDTEKPVGTPGGPHRMTQEQFDNHVQAERKRHADLAAAHGLKVSK